MGNPNILDWLDENSERAYPLSEFCSRYSDASILLPDSGILDAQIIHSDLPSTTFLESVTISGSTATIEVTDQSPFVISYPGGYIRNAENSLLVIGAGLFDLPDGAHTFTNLEFEHSVVYEFAGPWLGVSSVTFPTYSPLTGEIVFTEGYQFNVINSTNTITLGAHNLYGDSIDCETFGSLTSDCNSIISNIGGVASDGLFQTFIRAGPGVTVLDDPENHRIYIGFYFTSIADVCKDIPPYPAL